MKIACRQFIPDAISPDAHVGGDARHADPERGVVVGGPLRCEIGTGARSAVQRAGFDPPRVDQLNATVAKPALVRHGRIITTSVVIPWRAESACPASAGHLRCTDNHHYRGECARDAYALATA